MKLFSEPLLPRTSIKICDCTTIMTRSIFVFFILFQAVFFAQGIQAVPDNLPGIQVPTRNTEIITHPFTGSRITELRRSSEKEHRVIQKSYGQGKPTLALLFSRDNTKNLITLFLLPLGDWQSLDINPKNMQQSLNGVDSVEAVARILAPQYTADPKWDPGETRIEISTDYHQSHFYPFKVKNSLSNTTEEGLICAGTEKTENYLYLDMQPFQIPVMTIDNPKVGYLEQVALNTEQVEEELKKFREFYQESDIEHDGKVYDKLREPPGQKCTYILPGEPKKEGYRLLTFAKFPTEVPVDIVSLAKHGFFWTGYKDRVKCFSCALQVYDWGVYDDPASKKWHYRNCQLINGCEGTNVPLSKGPIIFTEGTDPYHRDDPCSSNSQEARQAGSSAAYQRPGQSAKTIPSPSVPRESSQNLQDRAATASNQTESRDLVVLPPPHQTAKVVHPPPAPPPPPQSGRPTQGRRACIRGH